MYGNMEIDNKVKMLRSRKADKERHYADKFADALFRIVLDFRFRSRGETHALFVQKIMNSVKEGVGERCEWIYSYR